MKAKHKNGYEVRMILKSTRDACRVLRKRTTSLGFELGSTTSTVLDYRINALAHRGNPNHARSRCDAGLHHHTVDVHNITISTTAVLSASAPDTKKGSI